MFRFAFLAFGCLVAVAVLGVPAAGQATVEAGLATAGASTSGAAARNVSRGISGVFSKLEKATGAAVPSKSVSPTTSGAAKSAAKQTTGGKAAPAVVPPKPHYEDAAGIEKGLGYEELLRRFGPPLLEVAAGNDAKTMCYSSGAGAVQVELQGGKVTSVEKPKSGA